MTNSQLQMGRYLVSGLISVSIDAASYRFMINIIPVAPAKGTAFLLGSVAAFLLNKYWTFQSARPPKGEAAAFTILYSISFSTNIAVNSLVLMILPKENTIGFLCATTTSIILNFIGQKFIVFRPFQEPGEQY